MDLCNVNVNVNIIVNGNINVIINVNINGNINIFMSLLEQSLFFSLQCLQSYTERKVQ